MRTFPDAPPPRDGSAPLVRMLVTGFGPFPGVPVNASAELACQTAARIAPIWPQAEIVTALLPTEWRRGPREAEALLRRHRPDIVLHFGVAREATGFCLETVAGNSIAKMPDAQGHVPKRGCISSRGPKSLAATFPARQILDRLQNLGLPASLSVDAGGYLCNATLYRTLMTARRWRRAIMTGFVHVPADLTGGAAASGLHDLDWNRALMGGLVIAETCLAQALEGIRLPA